MHKLYIEFNGKKHTIEFPSLKLLMVYRDYHFAFGDWKNCIKWVPSNQLKQEELDDVVEEKNDYHEGKLTKLSLVTCNGLKLYTDSKVNAKNIIEVKTADEKWEAVRIERDLKLLQTDWTQLPDAPIKTDERTEYRAYRLYLRNFPKMHSNDTIHDAVVYSFDDWKKGLR